LSTSIVGEFPVSSTLWKHLEDFGEKWFIPESTIDNEYTVHSTQRLWSNPNRLWEIFTKWL